MMHPIVKVPGGIRAGRPLRATTLAGLLLFAMTAATADNPSRQGSSGLPQAYPPGGTKVTAMNTENCTATVEWTHENPDNLSLKGFQYRTQNQAATGLKWGEWKDVGGGNSIRKASLAAQGGNVLQLRAAVSDTDKAEHSPPSGVMIASDLDPNDPKCQ